MRNFVAGSKMLRGKKKRTNIRKHVARKPATLAQTIRRRILFTGGSATVSSVAPVALAATGFAMPLATVGVGVVLAAPSARRAGGAVPAGTSLSGVSTTPLVEGFGFVLLSTPQTSICLFTGDEARSPVSPDDRLLPRSSDADYTNA